MIDRTFYYDDRLNLQEINNSNIDATQTQGFDYDDASRLATADGPYGQRAWLRASSERGARIEQLEPYLEA